MIIAALFILGLAAARAAAGRIPEGGSMISRERPSVNHFCNPQAWIYAQFMDRQISIMAPSFMVSFLVLCFTFNRVSGPFSGRWGV